MTTRRAAARTPIAPAVLAAAMVGALIALQSMANGDLAVAGTGAIIAGWVSYVGTLATILVVVVARRRASATVRVLRERAKPWWYAIGLCGIPIVLTSAYGVPIVGVAVASVGSVAGQTVAGLLLDSRGIGVPERLPLTGRRLAAALTAIAGLALAMVAGSGSTGAGAGGAVIIGVLFFVSGALLAVQNAGNGAVAQQSGDPVIAGFASATGGTVVITAIVAVAAAGGFLGPVSFPAAPADWYRYLGGPLGAAIVITAAWAVRRLGTFALTLTVVGGQLLTAVVADAVRGLGVGWTTVASVVAIIAATALGVLPARPATVPDDAGGTSG
ncbi:DMT family transporter [Propionicicella superfundia]|uniref:DMT family transporter n=1 Tax=Propionicicella superfundia TaxID=348582 RepID=UPI0004204234|nr:DMT family transporter [Propionicicella superfundia]